MTGCDCAPSCLPRHFWYLNEHGDMMCLFPSASFVAVVQSKVDVSRQNSRQVRILLPEKVVLDSHSVKITVRQVHILCSCDKSDYLGVSTSLATYQGRNSL